jgi:hypothetical protein
MNNNQIRVVLLNDNQIQQRNSLIVEPYYYKNCLIIVGLTILILLLCFAFALGFFWILFRKLPF